MSSLQDSQLYILAFDHRGSFQGIFGIIGRDPTPAETEEMAKAKQLIFDGFLLAQKRAASPRGMGILIDERFAAHIAEQARERNVPFALGVEKSGQDEFAFEYDEDFGTHIEKFQPSFVKALVRYNPQGDHALNLRQAARLCQLVDWLQARPPRLLLEVIVPPTAVQLQFVDGDRLRYDREFRPRLMQEALLELHEAKVEPALWKLEGLERQEDCEQIASIARAGGRHNVGCLVLGRGADQGTVEQWLCTAAPVSGYEGFAVGRTIWSPPLTSYLRSDVSRSEAVQDIATRYLHAVEVYRRARDSSNGR